MSHVVHTLLVLQPADFHALLSLEADHVTRRDKLVQDVVHALDVLVVAVVEFGGGGGVVGAKNERMLKNLRGGQAIRHTSKIKTLNP